MCTVRPTDRTYAVSIHRDGSGSGGGMHACIMHRGRSDEIDDDRYAIYL